MARRTILALLGLWGLTRIAPAQGRVYVANFGANSVSVIDASSNSVIATVMVGNQPNGIAITPDGTRAYVANGGGEVWVLSTSNNAVLAKVVVGGYPSGVAITPDGTRAYVTRDNANSVWVIDTSSNTVVAKIAVGTGPGGVAITPDGTRAYVTNVGGVAGGGSVSVINTASNTVTATVSVPGPVGVAITPDGTRAYVASPSGPLSVIDTASNSVVATVAVPSIEDSPFNVAISPDGTRVYVVTFGFGGNGPVNVIDTSSNTVATTIGVGTGPSGIAISPDGTRAYVAIATNTSGNGPGAVSVIDTSNNNLVATIPVGSTPLGVAITMGSGGPTPPPVIASGGVVPGTVEPGEWISIYGTNLAAGTAVWTGNFPTSLDGTSVMINGKRAYLSYVGPGQINLQVPNETATGAVSVMVTTATGSASSTVKLAQFGPAFFSLDGSHVAGIILRSDGSGAYGGGTYDIIGPTGTSLHYPTVAAKAGDVVELFGTGFGPTNPAVPAGQAFSGAAPTTSPVTLQINNVSVTPAFAGLSGAGVYQINLTVPAGLGSGDVTLQGKVGGVVTSFGAVISLQ